MGQVIEFTMSSDSLSEAVDRLPNLCEQLIAPVHTDRGDCLYLPVDSTADIAVHWGNSLVSPVVWVYPPKEVLFEFDLAGEAKPRLRYSLENSKRIIFGIRPCDTHAIGYLDNFLAGGDFVDSHYAARRENTFLVTVACTGRSAPPTDTCWCSCCEGGPAALHSFDVQLTPLGEVFLVEATERGRFITEAWSDLLEPAGEEHLRHRDAEVQRTKEMLDINAHMGAAMRRVTAGAVPEELWDEVGAKCVGCGGCSFVCPKCTCFNVIDELLTETYGRRVRSKDSCRLAGYHLEASGHNPRPGRSERARRWIYHKLSYRYEQRNEYHGCVGCGRCVTVCMGAVDMPTVAKQVREVGRSARATAAG